MLWSLLLVELCHCYSLYSCINLTFRLASVVLTVNVQKQVFYSMHI